MRQADFKDHQARLIQTYDDFGPGTGVEACETFLDEDLNDVQAARVDFIRSQFLLELPDRVVEGRECLKLTVLELRKHYSAGHPDRDQVETIARSAFGQRSLANPPDLAKAWTTYRQARRLSNDGHSADAQELLKTLSETQDLVLRSHIRMAYVTLFWNAGDPEQALRYAQEAADLVATLEVGHWARREVETRVLHKLAVIRKSVYPEPLRSKLSNAIKAVNEGDQNSLDLWRLAVLSVEDSGTITAVKETRRIDRLLTGFSGPLALLVALEKMNKAREQGEREVILSATEEAYYIAFEHKAHGTVRELEALLEKAKRLG